MDDFDGEMMQPYRGQCPECGKLKAMKSVKEFDGREWPGSLCKHCSHFVPDIQSKHYDIACADCGVAMGIKSLDYEHHEMDDAQTEAAIKAHEEKAAADRAANGPDKPKPHKIPESWTKRHRDRITLYHCAGCHKKRRKNGVDFTEVDTYVRHMVKCDVCKKHLAWHDFPEDHPAMDGNVAAVLEVLTCPGKCTDTSAEIKRQIQSSDVK